MLPLIIAKFNIVYFAAANDVCDLPNKTFFFFPPWWEYLTGKRDALDVCSPFVSHSSLHDIWLIGLAVLDMLLRLAGFLAVISIIIAGGRLITSEGNPEKAVAARNRIINSLIGLAIAVSAAAVVAFVGHSIASPTAPSGLPNAAANQGDINDILNIVFVVLGALAFLFIVIAGFRYVLAGGDTNKVASARRQIAYAAAGLILVASAAAIVDFVLGKL